MQVDEAFHRVENAIAQAAFMGAARAGGDQVDITLAHRGTVFGEGQTPLGALTFGKAFMPTVSKTFPLEQGDERVMAQGLHQIVTKAAFVKPGLAVFGFFLNQGDAHARHQHRLAAQQMGKFAQGQIGRLEILGVGPDPHHGALAAVARFGLAHLEFLGDVAALEHQMRHLAIAERGDFHAFGQCVGHAHAHTVQTAREAVRAALAFVELAARVQPGEHQFDDRCFFLGVHAKRDAAAIVLDADGTVGEQGDADFFAKTGQGFVGSVVDHLLDDVQRVVGPGVHARSLLDRLQSFENPDGAFGIVRLFGGHGPRL